MKDIKNLLSQMTLEEKASLCSGLNFWQLKGIDRLDIPSIMITDGPHGLRKQDMSKGQTELSESIPATCFPTASALAATWNRDLIFEVGVALAEECRQEKVGVILGPGVNIKRTPLCGRNFEYFSEDPFLAGEIAQSHIRGVQSQGIGTSLKHYAANNQEYRRMVIDAVVDERALREIYLAGFEIAVKKAQPWTLMAAYNKVNGTYCTENAFLMTEVLKKEWGHQGLVVTDWGAIVDRVKGLKAGVELEMPGVPNGNDAMLVAAVKSGELDEAVLDGAVERILEMIFKAAETLSEEYTYDRQEHHALARRVAGEGAVLLRNAEHLLPLPKDAKIAIIGRFAKHPRYQGAGSSLINPTRLDNFYDEMGKLVGEQQVLYAPGYTEKGEQADEALIKEALDVAREADFVVVCAGLTDMYETEGVDRKHMKLPAGHNALIEALADAYPNLTVVLSNGSPVEMPWVDKVPAILEGYLGGQAGAGAIADILLGRVNPSGKLAETFPIRLEDNPSHPYFPGGPYVTEYRESLYVGYRYYDTVGREVLFPFGYGLSYTTFSYSDLKLSKDVITDEETLTVSLKVKNSGETAGKEIVQLYVRDVESTAYRPDKELKGFTKVALAPGEEKEVVFTLDRRAFAYYEPGLKDWFVESGVFEILAGASSADIRLKAAVKVESTQSLGAAGVATVPAVYSHFPKGQPVPQADFEQLLGRPIPANLPAKKGEYTLNTPISEMQDSIVGRFLYSKMRDEIMKMIEGQEDTPTAALFEVMIKEAPLRTMLMASDGALTRGMLDALLMMSNGKFFSGIVALIKALRNKPKQAA